MNSAADGHQDDDEHDEQPPSEHDEELTEQFAEQPADEYADEFAADDEDWPADEYAAPQPIAADPSDVIENARRRYGGAGAALAAGMFGLDVLLGNKKKPESVQIQEAASEPIDVDKTGIQLMIDDLTSVEAPPLERRDPLISKKKSSRRR